MTRDEAIWLAGLLEGEGCFYLHRSYGRQEQPAPAIVVGMTDRDVVERVARLLGVRVREVDARSERHRDVFQVRVSGWPAVDVMEAVRPWMGKRRGAKIDELVAAFRDSGVRRRSHRTHCHRGHAFTPENTYVTPSTGSRRCRRCHNKATKEEAT